MDEDVWGPSLLSKPRDWLRQWRLRRNLAPGPAFEPVRDRTGRTYWLRQQASGVDTSWELFYRGARIGAADAWLGDEGTLHVGSLRIDAGHRGRALGAVLLRRIEALAQTQGAAVITGWLGAKDVEAFPGLPGWCRGQGFTVQPVTLTPSRTAAGRSRWSRRRSGGR